VLKRGSRSKVKGQGRDQTEWYYSGGTDFEGEKSRFTCFCIFWFSHFVL